MRESDFIKQNEQKWAELEDLLKQKKKDPDKLSNLFIQVTDDLSFSKTYFKNRLVRVYLNSITQQLFSNLYKVKNDKFKQVVHFWKDELPQIVYESRRELLIALITFLIAAIVGVVSYANEPEFASVILGDSYIQMTNENIKGGDPMAVYKKMNEVDMFLSITFNNVFVAFRTFIFGIIFSLGTIAVLLYNGIMVGVFQYFFYEKGLFLESFLTIWLHGTLEISSIIIAGGAGLVLGKGLVFPGTYSRLKAFQLSARKGLKLLIGILPILVFAAIIESFITRYTDTPDIIRASVIVLSATFIIWYFVVYPYRKAVKGFDETLNQGRLAPDKKLEIDFNIIKTNAEIFKDSFMLYKEKARSIFLIITISSVLYAIAIPSIYPFLFDETFGSGNDIILFKIFNYKDYPLIGLINTFIFSILLFFLSFYIRRLSAKNKEEKQLKMTLTFLQHNYYKSFLVSAAINVLFLLPSVLNIFVFVILFPFLLLWNSGMFRQGGSVFGSFAEAFRLNANVFGKTIGVYFMLIVVCISAYLLINSPFIYLYWEVLQWNILLDEKGSMMLYNGLVLFNSIFIIQLVLPLLCIGFNILYFSLKEIRDASYLKERIMNIGSAK